MLYKLIKKYQALDDDSHRVVNFLALSRQPLNTTDIATVLRFIPKTKLTSIIEQLKDSEIITDEGYYQRHVVDISLTIWLFPLICTEESQIYSKKNLHFYLEYSQLFRIRILDYLSALCFRPGEPKEQEKGLLSYNKGQIHHLKSVFLQPAYDPYINKISDKIVEPVFTSIFDEAVQHIQPFDILESTNTKLQRNASSDINFIRAEIAIIQGDFEQARKLSSAINDEAFNSFVEAIFAFIGNDVDKALSLFELGLKRQRRRYRTRHLPVLPEITLFYLSACMAKGQDFYTPVFRKIADEKAPASSSDAYFYFHSVCEYCVENLANAGQIASQMKCIDHNVGQTLWSAVASGLMDCRHDAIPNLAKYTQQALDSKHYVLAYETAYLLAKWSPDNSEYQQLFNEIAAKFQHKPALSHVKHPEKWEKQLNSYFSLEAVKIILRQNDGDGKTRVAYRFFPEHGHGHGHAYPILQTRNAAGWTSGRNIAMTNFVEKKVESMTEQDRRIASGGGGAYGQALDCDAIYEMTGHPYVYLENSGVFVELINAQPVINVVKLRGQRYMMKCDINNPSEGVTILKETNTRYKVYKITKMQCDIIRAISHSEPVPEEGYEKLMQILKHFSTYMHIQSDLLVEGDDAQVRQVDSDPRIRVQILPMGEGLKAEMFVKPFGTHPPYCKPGRGGKTLIANENGERVRAIRSLDDEAAYSERILNDIQSIENLAVGDDGLMTFDNPLDALELLDVLERHQDISVIEWLEGEQLKIRRKVDFNDLSLSVRGNINWFEVEGELKIDKNTVLSISELLTMIRQSRSRFVELSNGEFLSLSEQLRKRLLELAAFTVESKKGILLNRFASASIVDAFDKFENLKVDNLWRDFRERLETVQLSDASVSSLLQTELRPYQLSGYRWMIRLSEWGAGACLADDMGLGKTVQAIAVLLHRASLGSALVVTPVSVTPNWISEVSRFAPSLNIKTLRNVDRAATIDSLEAGDLLITSYGLLLSEEQSITAKKWATVILDEAHAIKNYNTKTSKAAMSLQSGFKLILTGTPIQNHLGEMWNLFQFINPGLLGSLSHFTETFIRPDDEKSRKRLKKLLTPFILRRTKTAVLEELPPKTEIIRKITLSDEEIAFYETLRRQALETLENDNSPQGSKHLKVLAEITRLRQACCNPSLVYPEMTIESTKLSTFLEIASELKDNGHRALVFSQFVRHLSIVRKALDRAGYTYCYLDGSTSVTKRESEVRDFQSGRSDFFLISLKAGGLGLNLTAADYVIHLDPWWNPAVEDQASDRAHRIGQNRPVTVYRLVAEQTIEEKIIQLHNTKRDLADSLLEGSDQSARLSISELISLIKI
jgi:SNF2 family DNA or RNA helicase